MNRETTWRRHGAFHVPQNMATRTRSIQLSVDGVVVDARPCGVSAPMLMMITLANLMDSMIVTMMTISHNLVLRKQLLTIRAITPLLPGARAGTTQAPLIQLSA